MPVTPTMSGFFKLLIAFFTIIALSACSNLKYSIYEMAVDHERSKAGLFLKKIEMDGKPIALLESERNDTKPTIVLVHGFSANKDNWVRFSRYLTDTCHVVAVDLPGHGDSVKDFNLPYDIDDQVGYLHKILGQLDIKRFHLAGNSMGGAISSLYAATHPEEVQSLWLFNPGGIYQYESEFVRLLKKGENPLIIENTDDFNRVMDFAMEKKPYIPWPITSVLAEKAVANKSINEKIFSDIRDDHKYVFQDEIQKISSPTIILWGKKDRLLNFRNASVFEKLIPGSKKIIFDEIGHMPMVEIPEKSAKICRDFMPSAKTL